MLRFRRLGALFSTFGCFVFEIRVLRASVFVFETNQDDNAFLSACKLSTSPKTNKIQVNLRCSSGILWKPSGKVISTVSNKVIPHSVR